MSWAPSNMKSASEAIVHTMKNYSKMPIRIIPNNQGTLRAGDTAVFQFPQAKILQRSSFRLQFKASTNGVLAAAAAGGVPAVVAQVNGFSKYISTLISQIEIFCNGVSVQNITNYNQIYKIMRDFSSDYEMYENKPYNNSDPSVDYAMTNEGVITKYNTYTTTGVLPVNQFKRDYIVDDFIGFFDKEDLTEGNDFFNTNLVGSFEVHITFAPNSVLWKQDAGAIVPTYEITDLYGWVDAVEFKDETYIRAIESKLLSGSHIIPFKNYRWYQGADTNATKETTIRVTENTQCLDKLLFTYLDSTRNTPNTLQLGNQGQIVGTSADAGALLAAQNHINEDGWIPEKCFNYDYLKSVKHPNLLNSSIFFRRNGVGLGYNDTRSATALIQYEIDSQDLHNPMPIASVYEETLKAFGLHQANLHKCNPAISNVDLYLKDFFVSAYSLSHLYNKPDGYLLSGVDTLATAMNIAVKVTNQALGGHANQTSTPVLITEFTSLLEIGAGRAVKVIQ